MKTNRLIQFAAAAFALAAFSSAGCAEKQKTTETSVPPAKDGATTTATTTQPGPSNAAQPVAAASPEVASARWSDIKDCTYDNRAVFSSGLARLEARVDDQVRELMAKRATMDGKTDTHDWDFAMKEMENARTNLKSMGEELNKASLETWNQQKDKVAQAWLRTQEAYGKVKSSTTN